MKVAIALGSNLGDRLAHVRAATARLHPWSRQPLRKSRLYETTPLDCPPASPKFLNAAVELEMDDRTSPQQILRELQDIETELGRKPKAIHNEPRPIDLDLIYCGRLTVNTRDLIVPHPRAHLRRFVLQPLCDLSPDLILPGQTRTVSEIMAALPEDASVQIFSVSW